MASIRVKTTKTTSGYRRKSDNNKKTSNKSKTVKTIRKYER